MAADIIDSMVITSFGSTWPTASIKKLREVLEEHEDELPENCFLRELIEELDANDDKDTCARCSTDNDYDAKFCKECGARLHTENETTEVTSLDWSGDGAAETFDSIFVKKLVPLIEGKLEGCVLYGDPDEQALPWKSCYFLIEDREIVFVSPDMERATSAPVFAEDT